MPRKDIDYQKSVIYKIEHLEKPELLYVGSTTDFVKRKNSHKNTCNKENRKAYNFKLYQMIRDNGGWDAFKIMVIKVFPCLNKIELLIEEEKQMKELKSTLNSMKAYQTDEELKASKKIISKEYAQLNKNKIKEHYAKKFICECGCEITQGNKYNHLKTSKHLNNLQ
jgi:hypothetical protein